MRMSSFFDSLRRIHCRWFAAGVVAAATILGVRTPAAPADSTTPSSTSAGTARQPIPAARPEQPKGAEYQLAYKFRVNEDVHMPLSVDAQILVQKGSAQQTTTNQSTVERHFHVVAVDADGSAIVQLFIDSVQLSYAKDNGTPVVFDSKKKGETTPEFRQAQNSIGPRGVVRFSPQGRVLPLAGKAPDPTNDPSESFLDLLPAKAVRVGDEWSDDIKVKVSVSRNLNQKITLRRRYTLESVNGNLATIRMRTVEIPPVQDPQIRAQLVQRTPEGTITFDIERGLTRSRDLTCSRTETEIMEGGGMIAATTHWKGSLR